MPDKIFIVNTVGKLRTRYARVTSATAHKSIQILCNGAVRINKSRWKSIPNSMFEQFKDKLLTLEKEGKIEIHLNGPLGPLYSENPTELFIEPKDEDVVEQTQETITIVDQIDPTHGELIEIKNVDTVEEAVVEDPVEDFIEDTKIETMNFDIMTKAALINYLTENRGMERSKLLTYSAKKLKELAQS
jgi:hypothetical protein